jgi:hypothetical protein
MGAQRRRRHSGAGRGARNLFQSGNRLATERAPSDHRRSKQSQNDDDTSCRSVADRSWLTAPVPLKSHMPERLRISEQQEVSCVESEVREHRHFYALRPVIDDAIAKAGRRSEHDVAGASGEMG